MNHLALKDLPVGVHRMSLVGRKIGLVGHKIDSGVGLVEVRKTSLADRMIDSGVDLVEVHTKRKVEAHTLA